MAKYETRALSVGDFTVTVSKAGKTGAERVVALLEKIAEAIVDPGYGVGAGNGDARPGPAGPAGPPRPGIAAVRWQPRQHSAGDAEPQARLAGWLALTRACPVKSWLTS